MKNILQYVFIFLLLTTIPAYSMLTQFASTIKKYSIIKRQISFVPSERYPGYLVALNRDITPKELKNSLHTIIHNFPNTEESIIIKYSQLTEKEQAFANNPVYIGLPDSGCIIGNDCCPNNKTLPEWLTDEYDYGACPVILYKQSDIAKWIAGKMTKPLNYEEAKKVLAIKKDQKQE